MQKIKEEKIKENTSNSEIAFFLVLNIKNTPLIIFKGTMYFDWLMEYLSLAQSGKNADVKTVVDDIDALIEMLGITPEAFERYCGKTTEDVKAAFQTPLTEREQLLFRILSLKGLLGSLHNRAASIEMLEHK